MFNQVKEFEKTIAEFFNSPYAVAVDCCTHGLELCLRYNNITTSSCPSNTYISVPFTFKKLDIDWEFKDQPWKDFYYLGETNIIDAAVYWKQNGYVPGTFMCLSFQFKKHLNLGRGGIILCEKENDYTELKKLSYDGRLPDIPWAEQDIDTIGYHYYMTPETAMLGLNKFTEAVSTIPKTWTYKDYPYLPDMKVFNNI